MLELTKDEIETVISNRLLALSISKETGLLHDDEIINKLYAEHKRLKDAEEYRAARAAEQAEREANRRYALTQAKAGDVIEYQAKPKGQSWSATTITRRAVIREIHTTKDKYGKSTIDMTITVLTKAGEPHRTLNTYGAYDADGVYQKNYATRVWNLDPTTVKLVTAP